MEQVRIRCFGALRDHTEEGNLELMVSFPCSASTLREEAIRVCGSQASGLIRSSAVSQGNRILKSGEVIERGDDICFLPPVNGG